MMSKNRIKIILRPLEQSYIESYIEKFSNSVMASLRVMSIESERDYLHHVLQLQKIGKTHFYCIFLENTNQLIGAIEIRDPDFSRGQLYTWLHHDYWGQGIFQESLKLAADDYFCTIKRHYFDATVDIDNMRSYKALKKSGFADIAMQHGAHGKQFILIFRNRLFKN